MAKKNGGVFSKFLNMIGIVDAEQEPQYRVYEPSYGGNRQPSYGNYRGGNARPQQGYNTQRPRNGYQPYSNSGRGYVDENRRDPMRSGTGSRYGSAPQRNNGMRPNTGYRMPQNNIDNDDNVVPFAQQAQRAETAKTVIYYLHRLDECTGVINDLISGKTVLVNLENLEAPNLQRAVDTLSGAAFAISATMQKASDRAYLISPTKVEIGSGEPKRPSYMR